MKLRHFASVYSDYEILLMAQQGFDEESCRYLVYTDEERNTGIRLEFTVSFVPEPQFELLEATTILYRKQLTPCPLCGTWDMEICPEYEQIKEPGTAEVAYLHDCGFKEEELMELAIEVYNDSKMEELLAEDMFGDYFAVETTTDNRFFLRDKEHSNRFLLTSKNVYHAYPADAESVEECPFCESNEFLIIDKDGTWMKCSVLSQHLPKIKYCIRNSAYKPIGLS